MHEWRHGFTTLVYRRERRRIVFNAVADDPHTALHRRAVFREQFTLALREGDDAAGRADHLLLHTPLRNALGGAESYLVLSAVKRVDVVDKRYTGAFVDGSGRWPQPKDMQVYNVRLPSAHEAHASLDGQVARDVEDRDAAAPRDSLHAIFAA